MGVKEQFNKIKDNWLIIAVVIVLAIMVMGGADIFRGMTNLGKASYSTEMMASDSYAYRGVAPATMPQYGSGGDFAPEVKDRIITKTASLSTEVPRGTFKEQEQRLKGIALGSKSIILSENANRYGETLPWYAGSYSLKVPVNKYDDVVAQLKTIGTVKGFTENVQDITGQVVSTDARLSSERDRLKRYQRMLDDATIIQDKLQLSDRIFSQEQTIKWLEEQQKSNDQRTDYATVSVTISEKQSSYVNIRFTRLGELVRALVASCNALLYLLAYVLPWVVLYGCYHLIRRAMTK